MRWCWRLTLTIEVNEEEDATNRLTSAIFASGQRLIRVEGHPGTGKSRVAKALAASLNGERLETDAYLDGKGSRGRKYPQMLVMDRLEADLHAMSERSQYLILDGIWLEAALPSESFGNGFRIYVKIRLPKADQADFRARNRSLKTDLYHSRFDPMASADIVVVKTVTAWREL